VPLGSGQPDGVVDGSRHATRNEFSITLVWLRHAPTFAGRNCYRCRDTPSAAVPRAG